LIRELKKEIGGGVKIGEWGLLERYKRGFLKNALPVVEGESLGKILHLGSWPKLWFGKKRVSGEGLRLLGGVVGESEKGGARKRSLRTMIRGGRGDKERRSGKNNQGLKERKKAMNNKSVGGCSKGEDGI